MARREAWPRPVPTVGDTTSAAERAADPAAWAFPAGDRDVLARVMSSRRDIRRFRPDPVPVALIERLLEAAHSAPSVGHSQPWRFVVVTDPASRARAAVLADAARMAQAAQMDPDAGRHLLDLDLEGIREAPLGLVVCCDRRVPAAGVLGRATFRDADMWSCACAIQNLWLAARAEGLGVGWVTLFEPSDLSGLVGAPDGVETLGWLCVGWPDERPPAPGLERRGWSRREPVAGVVFRDTWPASDAAAPPVSRLAAKAGRGITMPDQARVVEAHDSGDSILSAPGSLGVLDRAVDKVFALGGDRLSLDGGTLVLAAADHPVARLGVSGYDPSVTRTVAEATLAGVSVGAVAARSAGLSVVLVDAGVDGPPLEGAVHRRPGGARGDLASSDALSPEDTAALMEAGRLLGGSLGAAGDGGCAMVAVGEVGIGNTTVAAALTAGLLGLDAGDVVGLGAGADSATVERKRDVVARALRRVGPGAREPRSLLAALGGPEIALLAGVVRGVAEAGGLVVLDGLATCAAALVTVTEEPATAAHLVAGQRSRERAHPLVLQALGLEPLLDLRMRTGEGAGACMAASLLRAGMAVRTGVARTSAAADRR